MQLIKIFTFSLIASIIISCSQPETHKAWKGSAIIGNGEVCAVYSDDERLSKTGIQHFYYKNYTADYISSTSVEILKNDGTRLNGKKSIEMADFFSTSLKIENESNTLEIKSFALPKDAVVLSLQSEY